MSDRRPAPDLPRSAERWILAAILVLGFAVRALYLAEFSRAPDFRHPAIDAEFHDWWARRIAFADRAQPMDGADPSLETRAFLRPPGYPYFLAGVYALAGPGYVAPRIAQMALGLVSALIAWRLARRWLGVRAGLFAAFLVATWWSLVYFEGELHALALLCPLLLGMIGALARWSEERTPGWAALAGALFGASALVQPNVLLFGPFAAAWAAWISRASRRAAHRPTRLALAGAAFAACAALAILPATLRNWIVARDPVLISSNGGINLYIGNHEQATGFVAGVLPGLGKFQTCFDYPEIVASLERRVGHPLKDSEVSSWFTHEALAFIRAHPRRFLELTLLKTLLFWGPAEIAHNKVDELEREHSAVLRWLPRSFPFLLAAALAGFALAARDAWTRRSRGETRTARDDFVLLVATFVAAAFFSVLPFFVAARYRVPVLPFLALLAAFALERFLALALARDWRAFALGGIALALATLALSWSPIDYRPNVAKWHLDRGIAWTRSGEPALAASEYEAALEANPEDEKTRFKLANALQAQGELDRAREEYEAVLARDPAHLGALNNLGTLLARAGELDLALAAFQRASDANPAHALSAYNLGLALEQRGRLDEAVACYRRALASVEEPRTLRSLAGVLDKLGRCAEALPLVRRLAALEPRRAANQIQLAWLLATCADESARNASEAVAIAESVCRNESSPEALRALAAAYAASGRFEQAVATVRDALARARASGGANARLVPELERALELYQARQPWRAGD